MAQTLYWYDFETTGIDSRRDRVIQFAGIRTDLDFNVIGKPDVFYCRLHNDVLPHPDACLVTGISPQLTHQEGLLEPEFIKRIHQQFSTPQTCVAGFNSIRFDDEFTRQLLYRNFYDPYAREWKSGNSRWDIIDVLRMVHALRPEGINWPKRDDGEVSFKLELLTAANDISHQSAHDALSDVYATIAVAKLIKQKQPRLYDWAYALKDKRKAQECLDLKNKPATVHVSGKYPASKHCLAVVMPLDAHPVNKNAVIAYDLTVDPTAMLSMSVDQIHQSLYTATADLKEGEQRVALKLIHANKSPMLAPINTLNEAVATKIGIDLMSCESNRQKLLDKPIAEKLKQVFLKSDFEVEEDPDMMLYGGGFFSANDATNMQQIRQTPAGQLATLELPFEDERLPEMLFRYRARNFPESLSPQEHARWQKHRLSWLSEGANNRLTLDDYFERLDELVSDESLTEKQQLLVEHLLEFGSEYSEQLGLL